MLKIMNNPTELSDLALILAAAFIGGAVLRQLRQPVLVGYILVGTLFGPTGFGIVHDAEGIRWLAELGTLLLMFYIGLEIDLTQFRAVARPAIVTTILQIIIGIAIMLGISQFMGWPFKTAFLLGCSVALSSTAVAIKILEDMGAKELPAGQTSMGILIAQDIAVVPMMLIFGAMRADADFDLIGLVKLGVGLLILFGVLWFSTHQPLWFMHWARKIAKIKSKAMKGQAAVTSLAFCFAGAAIAGAYGLSSAYGAFVAGLMLSRTKNREKLQKNTRPIFDVLMMVFFLSVGLLIDLKFVEEHWILVMMMVFAALVVKTIVNAIALRCQGIKKEDAYLTAAVTGQIGEFSFLLAALGLSDKALGPHVYKYMVAVISLTLVFTPIWLGFLRSLKLIPKVKTILPGEMMEQAARGVA